MMSLSKHGVALQSASPLPGGSISLSLVGNPKGLPTKLTDLPLEIALRSLGAVRESWASGREAI